MPSTDSCIYTIAQSEKPHGIYKRGGKGTLTEKKEWPTAKKLLDEATKEEKKLLVFFAPAEDTRELIYYATLETIDFDGDGTTYAFQELTPYQKLKTSLVVVSTRKPLDADFIRPYAICKTPSELL